LSTTLVKVSVLGTAGSSSRSRADVMLVRRLMAFRCELCLKGMRNIIVGSSFSVWSVGWGDRGASIGQAPETGRVTDY
jgi:hypothetical protein